MGVASMYSIRRGGIKDIKSLVDLRMNFLREIGNIKNDTDIKQLIESSIGYFKRNIDNGFIYWVAEDNGKIVAISGLVLMDRPPTSDNFTGTEGYIMNIYVIPSYRHKGIAKAIMNEIISYLKDMDVKHVWLHSTEGGRILYEKMGFTSKQSEMEMHL